MFGSGFDLDATDPELRQAGTAAFDVLVESLVELQATGIARQEDVRTQANFVWAVVHGVAMLAIDGSIEHQGADPKALARYAVERLHTGIAVSPP